jgi:hypothetical protein
MHVIHIFEIDIALSLPYGLELGPVYFRFPCLADQNPYGISFIIRPVTAPRFHRLGEQGNISHYARVRPRSFELLLQNAHHRTIEFDHDVMSFVTILAPNVHTTEESCFRIDDDQFGMIRSEPWIGLGSHPHIGRLF